MLEFTTTEAQAYAEASRRAIDARLRESSSLKGSEFWRSVAKLYARGVPVDAEDTILPPSPVQRVTAFG